MEHINGWNRSEIMRKAHKIKDKEGLSFGDAIIESWVRARAEKLIAIEALIAPVTEPIIYTMTKKKVMKKIYTLQEAINKVSKEKVEIENFYSIGARVVIKDENIYQKVC